MGYKSLERKKNEEGEGREGRRVMLVFPQNITDKRPKITVTDITHSKL